MVFNVAVKAQTGLAQAHTACAFKAKLDDMVAEILEGGRLGPGQVGWHLSGTSQSPAPGPLAQGHAHWRESGPAVGTAAQNMLCGKQEVTKIITFSQKFRI